MKHCIGEVIKGIVSDKFKNFLMIEFIGNDGMEYGTISRSQFKTEPEIGEEVNVAIVGITSSPRGDEYQLSMDDCMIRSLLMESYDEFKSGKLVITRIVRVNGYKSKVVVINEGNINIKNQIVGPKGSLIREVQDKIGEYIDIVEYSEDQNEFIKRCISPNIYYKIEDDPKKRNGIIIYVPSPQFGSIIGKGGANIKLLAQLVNSSIEVVPVGKDLVDDGIPSYIIMQLLSIGVTDNVMLEEMLSKEDKPENLSKESWDWLKESISFQSNE